MSDLTSSPLSPAEELVLEAVRNYVGQVPAAALPATPGLDWQEALALSREHKVVPILRTALAASDSAPVPLELLEALERDCQRIGERNRELAAEASRLFQGFRECGLEAVFLKGVVVAPSLYHAVDHRSMGDIDVLVREDDIPRAGRCLRDLGYEPSPHEQYSAEWFLANLNHTRPWVRRQGDGEIEVDLHFSLVYRYSYLFPRVDIPAMIARARLDPASGLPRLDPVDTLIHHCLHATFSEKGRMPFLRQLLDVALCRRLAAGEEDELLARTARTGTAQFVFYALYLAEVVFGEPVGARLAEELGSQCAVLPRRWIEAQSAASVLRRTSSDDFSPLVVLWWTPGLLAKLRYFLRVKMFPSPEALRCKYRFLQGHPKSPLHLAAAWAINPFRVAWKYGPAALRSLRQVIPHGSR